MRIKSLLMASMVMPICFYSVTSSQAQDTVLNKPATTSEVEELKRRVAELERQQAEILRLLKSQTQSPAPIVPQTEHPVQQTTSESLVKWNEVSVGGSRIKLYGFLRLDLTADSQRPNIPQAPQFIVSPDAPGNGVGIGNFSLYSKFTRLGIDFTGPRIKSIGNASLTGRYEMDFFGAGGSEGRPIARDRFAWLRLDWDRFSLQMGQDWDIVSPLLPTPNQPGDMGYVGNTGDRRPQLKGEFRQRLGAGTIYFQGSAGLTGSTDQEDLDADGYRDGETSGRPNFQGRIAWSRGYWTRDKPVTIGIGGIYSSERTARTVSGRSSFHPRMVALDLDVPMTSKLGLRGEVWGGRHVSDYRGAINQGYNSALGREIRARGGWAELKFSANKFASFHGGVSTDDPMDADLPAGARTRNRSGYLGTRIYASSNFMIGIDFLRWLTDYKAQRRGADNRANLIFQYSF